jgi:aminopeptidase
VKDPRFNSLADVLIKYSTHLKKGEKVLIEATDAPVSITRELVRVAREAEADPIVSIKDTRVERALRLNASESQMRFIGEIEAHRMKGVDAYIGIRGDYNISELSDVPEAQQQLYLEHVWKPVHLNIRCSQTRWVVLRWPHPTMAQQSGMSTEAFEDIFFNVCTVDYSRMAAAMVPLVERMNRAEDVHITGPGTDLHISLAGMEAIACDGKHNVPDGEVAIGPVRESAEGTVQFNTRTMHHGIIHENVRLELKQGKIVDATSSNTGHLNDVLDHDENARYLGELAFGVNPYITEPILDVLFDEKICGSFHIAPGDAFVYDLPADNGNRSVIHWDIVCLQDARFGGGRIELDGELIRENGLFIPEDLQALNPENLK